jgi:hypothetical protein
MEAKKVVVKGGGSNLFKVTYYSGIYYVYKVKIGLITDDKYDIGTTKSFDDALSLIRSYSGQVIDYISSW